MSRVPPPSSAPPISNEAIDIVKRKVAPPLGPPPSGISINFKNPKQWKDDDDRKSNRFPRLGDDDKEAFDTVDSRPNRSFDFNSHLPRGEVTRQDQRPIPNPNAYREVRNERGLTSEFETRDSPRYYDQRRTDDEFDRGRHQNPHQSFQQPISPNSNPRFPRSPSEKSSQQLTFTQPRNNPYNYSPPRDWEGQQSRDMEDDRNSNRNYNSDRPSNSWDRERQEADQERGRERRGEWERERGRDWEEERDRGREWDRGREGAWQSDRETLREGNWEEVDRRSGRWEREGREGSGPRSSVPHPPPRLTASTFMASASGPSLHFNFNNILKATYRELRSFVTSSAPMGMLVRCYIERDRKGTNILAPYYSLCADLEDGTGRELMVCKKVLSSRSAHYVFSLKSEDLYRKREQRSRLYLGKLRAIQTGEYVLYDHGTLKNPTEDYGNDSDGEGGPGAGGGGGGVGGGGGGGMDSSESKGSGSVESLFRRELAVIAFNCKKRPAPLGVRGSEVCIPFPSDLGPTAGSGSEMSSTIVKPFRAVRKAFRQNDLHSDKCLVMHERTSRYDPLSSCLVDFKGRANMASVKNFQLVVSEPQIDPSVGSESELKAIQTLEGNKEFILQLGKTTEDCFNLDFRAPLSLLQAFALAIARFDATLNF